MRFKLLKYGLRRGEVVHISVVERGLKCGCVCPCCGIRLIAKKGKTGKRQEHFAHQKADQCEFAYETSVHLSAKEFLQKEKKISLPARMKYFDPVFPGKIFNTNDQYDYRGRIDLVTYELENIRSEKKLHDIVPDILASIHGKDIIIEIAVTHKVKEEKSGKIEKIGIPVIEIDLADKDHDISQEDLRSALLDDIKNKKWIYNPREDRLLEEIDRHLTELRKEIIPLAQPILKRGKPKNPWLKCPAGENHYQRKDLHSCKKCPYYLTENPYNVFCGKSQYLNIKKIIEETNLSLQR